MRVVIIGTSGAGKSTFAVALARAMDCPYIELDRLYWGPDWTPVPLERFEAGVRTATAGDHWVADGNYSVIRALLWSRATHIVWLNFGRRTVFPRMLFRTLRRLAFRTKLSHGNRESFRLTFLSRDSILRWTVTTFARNQRTFAGLRADPQYAHLLWNEITNPSRVREALVAIAAQGRTPRAPMTPRP